MSSFRPFTLYRKKGWFLAVSILVNTFTSTYLFLISFYDAFLNSLMRLFIFCSVSTRVFFIFIVIVVLSADCGSHAVYGPCFRCVIVNECGILEVGGCDKQLSMFTLTSKSVIQIIHHDHAISTLL